MFTALIRAKAVNDVMEEIMSSFQRAKSNVQLLGVDCSNQAVIEARIKKLQVSFLLFISFCPCIHH
jgi:hypothetical protein